MYSVYAKKQALHAKYIENDDDRRKNVVIFGTSTGRTSHKVAARWAAFKTTSPLLWTVPAHNSAPRNDGGDRCSQRSLYPRYTARVSEKIDDVGLHFPALDLNFSLCGRSMGSVQDYFYVTLNRHNTRIRSAKRRRRSLFTTPAVCAVRGARIREDRRRRSRFR